MDRETAVRDLEKYMATLEDFGATVAAGNFKRGAAADISGWKFKSVEGFYLKTGHVFRSEPLTPQERAYLRLALRGTRWRTRECYKNASYISGRSAGLVYCEGIGSGHIIPVQHAWVSLNGKAIDVTWRIDELDHPTTNIDRIIKRVEHNLATAVYWGVEIDQRKLIQHQFKTEKYAPLVEGKDWSFEPLKTGVL